MMEPIFSFGQWVRQRREGLGLTRPDLTACVGCSVSALRKIEADERRPSRQLAGLLADCLRIAPEEQAIFLDAARGVRRVDRLGAPLSQRVPLPTVPELASSYPSASNPLARPSWNLPTPATSLLGREAELEALARLLDDPNCRLLTLVGPGGVGKTRLALEVAGNAWENFADGVYFASLASVGSPEHLASAVAQALGLNLASPMQPRSQLMHFLSQREALLLLDNMEHLLDGVTLLAELLAGAAGVKLLATSRERLELSGEWIFEVQGLPMPLQMQPGETVEGLENVSAVQLFLERARQARADFELSANNSYDVVRICRLVEGMPLALELAATWVAVLPCTEIADEIEQSLDILATRLRDVPERQRSLRAVFDHSWRLLGSEEQQALSRLSVFRGGFQREAAQAVAGAHLTLLSAMISKSLLRRTSAGRYSLHELVRQYAAEHLAEAPAEEVKTRGRHSSYYGDLVAQLKGELKGAGQMQALAVLDVEIDNIRAGCRWAEDHHDVAVIGSYVSTIMHFYEIRGWHDEAVRVCEEVIATLNASESEEAQLLVVRTQAFQAGALQNLGQLREAQQLLDTSLEGARKLNSSEDIAHALMRLGSCAIFSGSAQAAMPHFQQALEAYEALDDHYGRVWALQSLGWATLNLQHVDLAQQFHHRSLPLLRAHGPQHLLAWTLFEIGGMARERGDYEEAQRYLEEAKTICEEIGYHFALLSCLLGLGQTAEVVGQYHDAQRYYEGAVALHAYLGEVLDIATGLALLSRVTLISGDTQRAESCVRELQVFSERSANRIAQGCYEYARGELALAQGDLEEAERFLQQSVTTLRPSRRRALVPLALLKLGQIYLRFGDDQQAEAAFHEALQGAWEKSSVGTALEAVGGIGALLARQGRGERAVEVASHVKTHPATSWLARQQADELLKELKEALPQDRMATAMQRGREQTLDVLVAELLGDDGSGGAVAPQL